MTIQTTTPAAAPAAAPAITLTAGQEKARAEIMAAMGRVHMLRGAEHCLMGYAGTGKTTMMMVVVKEMQEAGKRVAVCAPTNKAVAVLERKMLEAEIEVETRTIYSLLGLTPGSDDAKRKPKRVGKNHSTKFDVVIIDECSMIGMDLMDWIKQDLASKFVLYIGDPAQLPPVGETLSQAFQVESKSVLDQIMRQAADNPIIALSIDIRAMINAGKVDWLRFVDADDGTSCTGIYRPGPDESMAWIEDAFTSPEFAEDNDRYRYLCWTNARVQFVNTHIRRLIYGDTPTPFVPGERILVRSSIQDESGNLTLINTNDEATVESIKLGEYSHNFDPHTAGQYKDGRTYDALDGWTATMPVWEVQLRNRAGILVDCRIPVDANDHKAHSDRLTAEAAKNRIRWHEFFSYQDKIAKLQSVYAMTVHCSQGSTFQNVFVDLNDCARNAKTVEMLQLLYVACTRPQRALVLV